ncbi:hypothetical protein B0G52_13441 [Cohnella sp. SGD-V74]|nr:hypothetical protein B0G52_13441 [Cohnella sp. SGD-V74]
MWETVKKASRKVSKLVWKFLNSPLVVAVLTVVLMLFFGGGK